MRGDRNYETDFAHQSLVWAFGRRQRLRYASRVALLSVWAGNHARRLRRLRVRLLRVLFRLLRRVWHRELRLVRDGVRFVLRRVRFLRGVRVARFHRRAVYREYLVWRQVRRPLLGRLPRRSARHVRSLRQPRQLLGRRMFHLRPLSASQPPAGQPRPVRRLQDVRQRRTRAE